MDEASGRCLEKMDETCRNLDASRSCKACFWWFLAPFRMLIWHPLQRHFLILEQETKIQLPLTSSLVSLKQRPYLSSNVTVESSAMLPWAAKYHKTVGWFWDSVGLLLGSGLFSWFIGRHRYVEKRQICILYIIYSITLQIYTDIFSSSYLMLRVLVRFACVHISFTCSSLFSMTLRNIQPDQDLSFL